MIDEKILLDMIEAKKEENKRYMLPEIVPCTNIGLCQAAKLVQLLAEGQQSGLWQKDNS